MDIMSGGIHRELSGQKDAMHVLCVISVCQCWGKDGQQSLILNERWQRRKIYEKAS